MKHTFIIFLYDIGDDLLNQVGNAATGGIAGGVAQVMGLPFQAIENAIQRNQQKKLSKQQLENQKSMMDYSMQKQLEMWNATNYEAQIQHMKNAGLNPDLMYNKGGAGGATTGSPSGNAGMGMAVPGTNQGIAAQQAMANVELMKSQANKNNVEAAKIAGVDTENIKADTTNKILEQVIKEYTGKEAKDMYERVNAPNRAVQMETVLKEMEARQGIAGTIYDMWLNGQLAQKSTAEIERILLQNSKTREETKNITKQFDILDENLKGIKLDNVIKDLETKLQTQTGIDKNSPAWLKILGRLFVQLMNQ